MKARYYFLILIVFILTSIFFPKLIIVHYQNVEEPITIYLQQYDKTSVSKKLADGSKAFILKKGSTLWSDDFAYLGWYWASEKYDKNRHEGFISFIGEKDLKNSDLDLTVCRVHLYLDQDAKVVKREIKYPIFLNLCI